MEEDWVSWGFEFILDLLIFILGDVFFIYMLFILLVLLVEVLVDEFRVGVFENLFFNVGLFFCGCGIGLLMQFIIYILYRRWMNTIR